MFKKKREKKERKTSLKTIFFSLIVAIAMFFVLVAIETSILDNYEKEKVVVAIQEVENGTEITKENVEDYFYIKEVDKSLVTKDSVLILSDMPGYIVKDNISMGEIVNFNRLVSKTSVLANIKVPVETSLKVADLSDLVGGTIRSGDLINISVVNKETNENEEILKNVFVSQAFDSSGAALTQVEDKPAITINVIIDKSFESEFNTRINQGKVRVSKVSGI